MMTRFQTGSVLWKLTGAETIQLQTDQLINRYNREFDRLEKGSLSTVVLMMISVTIFGCPMVHLMALMIVLILDRIATQIAEHRTRTFETPFEEVDGQILPPLQEQGDHLLALTLGLRLALLQYRAQEFEEFEVEDTLTLSDTINLI